MNAETSASDTLPPPAAPVFRATVHGMAFAGRTRHLRRVGAGEPLVLVPDPPGGRVDQVWVHLREGDPLGHLPDEIGRWLAPWMRRGGPATVRAVRVGDASVPTWKRLLVEVVCEEERPADA
ncbi:MAG TPA: hypothetical protein VKB18_11700 [Gemmatimonadota bacterium]|nr:hypothetical protein [Gemmatimonadota bacterium]